MALQLIQAFNYRLFSYLILLQVLYTILYIYIFLNHIIYILTFNNYIACLANAFELGH
jgi:hypothetical protein